MRAHGEADPSGTLWGKLAYLAPEVLEREPLTPQADLWSAAAVLYECLAGQRALQAANTEALQGAAAGRAHRAARVAATRAAGGPRGGGAPGVLQAAANCFASAAAFREALAPYDDEAVGGALGIASMVRGLFGA